MVRRKRALERTERHHVLLYVGDMDRLIQFFPDHSPSSIIRALVRKFLNQAEEQMHLRRPEVKGITPDELRQHLKSVE